FMDGVFEGIGHSGLDVFERGFKGFDEVESDLFKDARRVGEEAVKAELEGVANEVAEFAFAEGFDESADGDADARADFGEIDLVEHLEDVLQAGAEAGGEADKEAGEFFFDFAEFVFDVVKGVAEEERRVNLAEKCQVPGREGLQNPAL